MDKVISQTGQTEEIRVEVRYQHEIGKTQPELDEVVLYVNSRCVFHLEQMDDNIWWMGIGDPEGQYVSVRLFAKRATVFGIYEDEGKSKPILTLDGREWRQAPPTNANETTL